MTRELTPELTSGSVPGLRGSGTAQPADQRQTRRQARQQAARARLLISLLGTRAAARQASSARKQAWVLIIPAGFLFVLFFLLALMSLTSAWHDGKWGIFWEHMAEVLFFGHFALSGNAFGALAALRDGARSLRQAVTDGDDALAPPAAVQPGPLTGSELVTGPLRVGPLHRYATEPVSRRRITMAVTVAVVGTVMTAFLVGFFFEPLTSRHRSAAPLPFIITFTILVAFLFGFALWLGLWLRRGYYVQVDDYGIRRSGHRGQTVIPWSDVHGFFCVTYQPNPRRSPVTEYLLDAGKSLMRWRLPADATLSAAAAGGLDALAAPMDVGRAGFAPPSMPLPSASWSERDRSLDTFARLIVARTHIPLRDITPALQRIAAAAQTQAKPKRGLFGMLSTMKQASQMATASAAQPAVSGVYAPATFAPVAPGDVAQPAKKKRRFLPESRALRVALVVQLALALLLAAAGFGLQRLQPGYYRDLLTAVHAQHPLYTTTLAGNDGLWPEHGPTADDPSSTYAFVDGAYQLTGTRDGWTVNAPATPVYRGPLAVEATVTQLAEAAYSGVGVLLYYTAQPESYVVFWVQPEGKWKLYWYTDPGTSGLNGWTLLASGSSDAIARSPGAANTVLVVNWGARYVLYVNDTWVYDYNGSSPKMPQVGQFGVFLNDGPSGGRFTNFTIYPAPPQPFGLPLP